MTAALHRVGQFWRHASASVAPSEHALVQGILGPALAPLFDALPTNDQRHGLDVLQTLERVESKPSLLLRQAALLHDVGKGGARFTVMERSLTVFLRAVSPRLLEAVLRRRPSLDARYRLYADHARIGAEQLRRAGADALAGIVEEHHAPQPARLETLQLQRADRRN